MIAVIADDLTGAAEMAGIGWRHGLRAEILERDAAPSRVDLAVYNSDSRNCSAAESRRRVRLILSRLKRLQPDWLYKKTDSVLRGNVVAEIETILQSFDLKRCVLAPANPAAGRVIRNGEYFIHGTPIHRTDFRRDPHHPRTSCRVTRLLVHGVLPIAVCESATDVLPDGIVVGSAASQADVRRWARAVDAGTLPAGGADFFKALLERKRFRPKRSFSTKNDRNGRTLFVCGSSSQSTAEFLARSRTKGRPVIPMPHELTRGSEQHCVAAKTAWAEQIVAAFEHSQDAIASIEKPELRGTLASLRLGRRLAEVAGMVLRRKRVQRVCVEGGATAEMLIQLQGWNRLVVECEFSTGVVGLRVPDRRGLMLIVKPGSYRWPPALL